MSKLHLFIDADDTLLMSNLSIRLLYSKEFNCPLPDELLEWNGLDQLHLAPENYVQDAFNRKEIWDYIKLFDGCKESLQALSDTGLFDMKIASIGSPENIKNKIDFLEKHNMGKYFSDYIMITKTSRSFEMGKDFLKDGLLIDDNIKNFTTIKRPILFTIGEPKRWNDGWKGSRINGWNEQSLNTIMKIAIDEINSK